MVMIKSDFSLVGGGGGGNNNNKVHSVIKIDRQKFFGNRYR